MNKVIIDKELTESVREWLGFEEQLKLMHSSRSLEESQKILNDMIEKYKSVIDVFGDRLVYVR